MDRRFLLAHSLLLTICLTPPAFAGSTKRDVNGLTPLHLAAGHGDLAQSRLFWKA